VIVVVVGCAVGAGVGVVMVGCDCGCGLWLWFLGCGCGEGESVDGVQMGGMLVWLGFGLGIQWVDVHHASACTCAPFPSCFPKLHEPAAPCTGLPAGVGTAQGAARPGVATAVGRRVRATPPLLPGLQEGGGGCAQVSTGG